MYTGQQKWNRIPECENIRKLRRINVGHTQYDLLFERRTRVKIFFGCVCIVEWQRKGKGKMNGHNFEKNSVSYILCSKTVISV